jgi:hypothetical protein
MKCKRATLVVAALLALAFAVGAGGDDGLPIGQDFNVPLIVAGKATEGTAFITADRVMRIYYVADGKIARPILYTLTRGGDVQPPIPGPKPPVPTPGKANKMFVIWESNSSGPEGVAIANLVRRAEKWKKEAAGLGIQVVVVDVTESAGPYPSATKMAKDKGIPALVFGRDNAALGAYALPKTEDEIIKLVREKGGVR